MSVAVGQTARRTLTLTREHVEHFEVARAQTVLVQLAVQLARRAGVDGEDLPPFALKRPFTLVRGHVRRVAENGPRCTSINCACI